MFNEKMYKLEKIAECNNKIKNNKELIFEKVVLASTMLVTASAIPCNSTSSLVCCCGSILITAGLGLSIINDIDKNKSNKIMAENYLNELQADEPKIEVNNEDIDFWNNTAKKELMKRL